MNFSPPLPPTAGRSPSIQEIRDALEVLEDVLESATAGTAAESAFIAGAAAALRWVLGEEPPILSE
jgi:hypothetical protein